MIGPLVPPQYPDEHMKQGDTGSDDDDDDEEEASDAEDDVRPFVW